MNIKNTMCKLSELSQWEIDSLRDAMGIGCFDFFSEESFIGFTKGGCAGTWSGSAIPEIISYTEMMQLLGKTMRFTKSDLKTGMFVKQRDGMFMLVLEKAAVGSTCFTNLADVKENLLSGYAHLDIVAVYEAGYGGVVNDYMRGEDLTLIWERTEQTEAQKEMEVLQAQAKALQEQAQAIQEQITKLQGTL
jgi:hypothetical protein